MEKQETIEVMYSCSKCGANKVKFNTIARESKEDVVQWVNSVVSKCGDNHKALTGCIPDALDLYIPADKSRNWIGGPRIN